jgi:ribonucleoside-triphosphate reductase
MMDGGALTHIFLGEANPDPDALWALNMKIARNTLSSYWAFTKDVMSCPSCYHQEGIDWRSARFATIEDLDNIPCPICGKVGVDIISRVTGYQQSVSTYNKAKRQEFIDRHRYTL